MASDILVESGVGNGLLPKIQAITQTNAALG